MSEWLFWGLLGLVAYTYVGYPLLLALRGLLWRHPHRSAEITPHVSMIICAHNEEASIGRKLENVLCLDYPDDRLEVLVASDGSTDGTNAIVRRYASRGVRLLSLPRRGKIPSLNAALPHATGEILVFSDANSIYAPDAIRALVRPFADPGVGGVAGDQRYLETGHGSDGTEGERVYWSLDRQLKEWQSRSGSATSATGAIYAIRRELFREVVSGVTDDFFISTSVVAQGKRLVFNGDAVAYEPVAASSDAEFQRKVRIITRGLRGVLEMRELLDPFRHGFYSLQLFSHKVLRRLVAIPLLLLFLVSLWTWRDGWIHQAAAGAQIALYGAAAAGALFPRLIRLRIFGLPFYFCMVNAAALMAAFNLLRGRRIESWEPERSHPDPEGGPAHAADRQGEAFSATLSHLSPPEVR
jgi:cellulose synthase/poly-beta-1,6-N-acetylglucosamine synthase-like glycosyltransferase